MILYVAIAFALQTVRVDGESMVGTLQNQDLLLASKISYDFGGNPQRGDIVILIPPTDPSQDFIKRVIGLPGDVIEINGNHNPTQVLIKPGGKGAFQALKEPYLPQAWTTLKYCCTSTGMASSAPEPLTIPAGEYFVMGDNRNFSSDFARLRPGAAQEHSRQGDPANLAARPFRWSRRGPDVRAGHHDRPGDSGAGYRRVRILALAPPADAQARRRPSRGCATGRLARSLHGSRERTVSR